MVFESVADLLGGGSSTEVIYECSECGTTVSSGDDECPNCGSSARIVEHEIG